MLIHASITAGVSLFSLISLALTGHFDRQDDLEVIIFFRNNDFTNVDKHESKKANTNLEARIWSQKDPSDHFIFDS